MAAGVFHAVADRFLVNVQPHVIHTLHAAAPLVESESAGSLSSAFLHQALLPDLFIQTFRELIALTSVAAEPRTQKISKNYGT
jgi:hypothetical protein